MLGMLRLAVIVAEGGKENECASIEAESLSVNISCNFWIQVETLVLSNREPNRHGAMKFYPAIRLNRKVRGMDHAELICL